MSLLELLFGFQGRINRLKYWLGFCTWVVIGVLVYLALKIVIAAASLDTGVVLFWGLGLLFWSPSSYRALPSIFGACTTAAKAAGGYSCFI
jgi:uncharacterized membrane protein YhaH (DUF805 family)